MPSFVSIPRQSIKIDFLQLPNVMVPPANGSAGKPFTPVANQVNVYKFVLGYRISISKISFIVNNATGPCHVAFGIYSSDGSKKLVDTGAITVDIPDSSTIKTVNLANSVDLSPGEYFLAWTADSNIIAVTNVQAGYSVLLGDSLINKTSTKLGSAANPSVAGVLPSTLGALTAFIGNSASSVVPYCVWE